ncbi:GNAT family N-acetyltransferase [Rhabdobacter roseus]|uniref:N-acetyltransferase domain-containing protein n=1 Tax=Rhabdobacter roseus TaxID=1655419 RepID=A0A840TXL5_9BACT|nr:GNAT family N-acetyltransferase [Rhabdobacter roseus]MBB5284660.1 hypothetical protein [Rhabdobacter roseus]
MATPEFLITHEPDQKRFVIHTEAGDAYQEYLLATGRIVIAHTEVPEALEGQGIGSALAKNALEYTEANDLKILPLCPFMATYMRRHPQYHHLLAAGFSV